MFFFLWSGQIETNKRLGVEYLNSARSTTTYPLNLLCRSTSSSQTDLRNQTCNSGFPARHWPHGCTTGETGFVVPGGEPFNIDVTKVIPLGEKTVITTGEFLPVLDGRRHLGCNHFQTARLLRTTRQTGDVTGRLRPPQLLFGDGAFLPVAGQRRPLLCCHRPRWDCPACTTSMAAECFEDRDRYQHGPFSGLHSWRNIYEQ